MPDATQVLNLVPVDIRAEGYRRGSGPAKIRGVTVAEEKYISTTTFRRSGADVATPTWVVPVDGGRLGFWTSSSAGKTKRLRNNPRVTVQPCDSRGRVKAGSAVTSGTAVLTTSGPEFDQVKKDVPSKYGVMVPISHLLNTLGHIGKGSYPYGDVVVVITLDS